MSEAVQVTVTLSSLWHIDPPKVKIFLDEIEIDSADIVNQRDDGQHHLFSLNTKLDEGNHKIKIVYYNKTFSDTVLDGNGNIVKDQLLHVEDISIDEVELGYLVYKNCKFYPDREIRPDLPEVINNLTSIGYNGVWELEFTVPTYIWLLEHF